MLTFLLRRIAIAIPTLLIISVIVFSLQQLLPGDPAILLAGEDADPTVITAVRAQYGFDQPLPVQYVHWLGNVARGDFGVSYRTKDEIGPELASKIPITLTLAVAAMLLALAIGIPIGILSALWRGSGSDHVIRVFSISSISIPNFWLAIMLILLFAVRLGWLPPGGYVGLFDNPLDCLRHLAMPAFVLGVGLSGALMRHTRSAMLTVLQQDYVRTARAKGLLERTVILRHALRNAQIPIITLATLQFGTLLAGAILTEQVFSIPGIGKMVVDAVFNREYAAVQAITLLSGFTFVLMSLLADVLYFWANPKLRTNSQ